METCIRDSLAEDNSLIVISKNLTFDVLLHGTRKDYLLKVLSLEDKRLRCVLVSDAYYILLNDWTSIELCCDIVACGSDDLHTTLVCLMIWLGTYERRKERVMDIDDVVRIVLNHLVANDLHVASKDDECHLLLAKKFHLRCLYLSLVGMILLDAPYIVWDIELLADIAKVLMVADNARYVNIELACLIACKEVVKAMGHLAHEECHARLDIAEVKIGCHVVALAVECVDILSNLIARDKEALEFPFHTHEEHLINLVYILVKVDDITIVVCYEFCNLCNDTLLVRTMQKEYSCWFQIMYDLCVNII